MDHPDVDRWIEAETVVRAENFPELAGTLVTKQIKILSDVRTPDYVGGNPFRKNAPETRFLIRQGCLYALDGWDAPCAQVGDRCVPAFDRDGQVGREYREVLLHNGVAADVCFPMTKGKTWGKVPSTSPAEEYVWHVAGLNLDPFGRAGARTYHLTSYGGSGESIDRWFEPGVGIIQEMHEHHGTFDEDRKQLLKATIGGKTRTFELTSARTVPFGPDDCAGPRWRHFSRVDGTLFGSLADCLSYSSR